MIVLGTSCGNPRFIIEAGVRARAKAEDPLDNIYMAVILLPARLLKKKHRIKTVSAAARLLDRFFDVLSKRPPRTVA